MLEEIHDEDLADLLGLLDENEAAQILKALTAEEAAPIFERLDEETQEAIVEQLGVESIAPIVSEMAGALGPMVGAPRRYDGPMGKSDRAFVFGALGLWIGAGGPMPGWLVSIMVAVAALIAWNIVNRVRAGVGAAPSR